MSLKENINFSLWCDFIERDFLENKFQKIIKDGIIHGATSNPAIFASSITSSSAYKQQLDMLKANSPKVIYEELAIKDIKRAANLLAPLHDENSNDGFISLEVDPMLCDDTKGTIEEGLRLNSMINYDNIMIKVPATKAGYVAIKELTSQGINVNATLVFSVEQAIECAKALNEGIKEANNKDVKGVISVFVSRFDRLCDETLVSKGFEKATLGIMNVTKCYHEINKFNNENIRILFASTTVKGNELNESYYINKLLYPNSINTAPLATIEDWVKNGSKEPSIIPTQDQCDEYFHKLSKAQINMSEIYDKLLSDGLEAFKISFSDLLNKLAK